MKVKRPVQAFSMLILFFMFNLSWASPESRSPVSEASPKECGFNPKAKSLEKRAVPGTAEFLTVDRPKLRSVRCHVLIPPLGGFQDGKEYPLLVLLHGLGDKPVSWFRHAKIHERVFQLTKEGVLPPTAILVPSGASGYWTNWVDNQHPYEDIIVKDLINLARERYPLSRDPKLNAIGGVSMGGFGALSIGLRHPEIFGSVLAFSATDMEIGLRAKKPRKVYYKLVGFPPKKKKLKNINPYHLVLSGLGRKQNFAVVYGTSEPAKFKKGGERFVETARDNGIRIRRRVVKHGRHGWVGAWNQESIDWSLDWLGRWFKGE